MTTARDGGLQSDGPTPATFRIRAHALRVIAGNGAALSRPVADTTMELLRETAQVVLPAPAATVDARPREVAIGVLSEVVPAAANVVEHARSARTTLMPLALAVVGGALLGPMLRRLTRR
jgi:hypothetical protein